MKKLRRVTGVINRRAAQLIDSDTTPMRSLALVVEATQLLNVLEWTYQAEVDLLALTTVVLAPSSDVSRRQLGKMTELARAMGHTIRWHEPRDSAAATARTVRTLAVERSWCRKTRHQ